MDSNFIKSLLEQRANIWEEGKALLDAAAAENRDLTGEEDAKWKALNAAIDERDARIKDVEEAQQRSADAEKAMSDLLARSATREDRGDPAGAADEEARKFFRGEGGKSFEVRANKPMGSEEFRVLSKLSAGAGLNTVKTSFYDQLVAHLIEVSGILQAGPTVLNTTSGESLQVPKTTSHGSAALVAEGGTIAASDPAFGQITLGAYKYGKLIQVSSELVNDTSVDLLGYLAMSAGRAVGNALGTDLVVGAGSTLPRGVVTDATLGVTGVTTGVAGAFLSTELIDLYFSVIAPYRNSPSAGWLMKDATLGAVRKLKDTTGQFLWQPSLQIGVPDTLLGKAVHTDPNVAAVATSAKSVLFGDFSQYFVRMVNGIRFERSDDYAFNTDLVSFRCLVRADGALIDLTGAVKYFVGAAT